MKLANKDNSLSFRLLDCLVLWIFTEADQLMWEFLSVIL